MLEATMVEPRSDSAVAVAEPQLPAPAPERQALQLEEVVIKGDLSSLTPAERLRYYGQVCKSLGLNPLTKPFMYISFPQKGMQLYATRDCTDQLRKINRISITDLEGKADDDIYVVVAKGIDRENRTDMATGAVPYGNLKGEARANAIMKAETKAKRRLTLSLAGLGWLDEVEVESIDEADSVNVDPETGEILPGTWEGRVRIGDKPGVDYEAHYTGSVADDADSAYQDAWGGEPGVMFAGFKLEMGGRKTAQVVAFGDLAESLWSIEHVDDPSGYGPDQQEVARFKPGDRVRVMGHLSFVAWTKDGRKMPDYRRIIATSIEAVE